MLSIKLFHLKGNWKLSTFGGGGGISPAISNFIKYLQSALDFLSCTDIKMDKATKTFNVQRHQNVMCILRPCLLGRILSSPGIDLTRNGDFNINYYKIRAFTTSR